MPTTRTPRHARPQPLAEALQAGQRARRDVLVEPALLVHAAAEAHHLAQPVDDDQLAVGVAGDDQVETVGAEVDRGQDVRHARRPRLTSDGLCQAANEEPQPQVVVALGLRITNCAPSRPSR